MGSEGEKGVRIQKMTGQGNTSDEEVGDLKWEQMGHDLGVLGTAHGRSPHSVGSLLLPPSPPHLVRTLFLSNK